MIKIKKQRTIIFLLSALLIFLPTTTHATISTENVNEIYVIPGGEPFGIKMFSDGLIVTKLESFFVENKSVCPGKDGGLKTNDIIYSANGNILYSNNSLKSVIENSEGKTIKLKIKRNNNYLDIYITPQKNNENIYKAGIWVKDSAAGLGTISFYHEDKNTFCGLGHGICNTNTENLIPLSYGEIDKANVVSITKSSNGCVGTLNGYFTDNIIGNAYCNHSTGIYGYTITNIDDKEKIELAQKDEVKKGKAYILTTINGETPQKFEIEIVKINLQSNSGNMTIKITDKALIDTAGGIVQGMSGSPIIQNDKLVGALTHVLVDNVNYGYGIFAQTMYEVMCEI